MVLARGARQSCPHPSLDACCLLEVGRRHQNLQLRTVGTTGHTQVLSLLKRELKSTRLTEGTLIAAGHILQGSEFLIVDGSGMRWRAHAKGLAPLMMVLRDQCSDPGIRATAIFNCRWFGFWDALLSSTRLVSPELATGESVPNHLLGCMEDSDSMVQLLNLSIIKCPLFLKKPISFESSTRMSPHRESHICLGTCVNLKTCYVLGCLYATFISQARYPPVDSWNHL